MKISGQREANCWVDVKVEGEKGEMLLKKPAVSEPRWNVNGAVPRR